MRTAALCTLLGLCWIELRTAIIPEPLSIDDLYECFKNQAKSLEIDAEKIQGASIQDFQSLHDFLKTDKKFSLAVGQSCDALKRQKKNETDEEGELGSVGDLNGFQSAVPSYPTASKVKLFQSLSSDSTAEANQVLPTNFGVADFIPEGVSLGGDNENETAQSQFESCISSAFNISSLRQGGVLDRAGNFFYDTMASLKSALGNPFADFKTVFSLSIDTFTDDDWDIPAPELGNISLTSDTEGEGPFSFLNCGGEAGGEETETGTDTDTETGSSKSKFEEFLSNKLSVDIDLDKWRLTAEQFIFETVGINQGNGFSRLIPRQDTRESIELTDDNEDEINGLLMNRCDVSKEGDDFRAFQTQQSLQTISNFICASAPRTPLIGFNPACLVVLPIPMMAEWAAELHIAQCELQRGLVDAQKSRRPLKILTPPSGPWTNLSNRCTPLFSSLPPSKCTLQIIIEHKTTRARLSGSVSEPDAFQRAKKLTELESVVGMMIKSAEEGEKKIDAKLTDLGEASRILRRLTVTELDQRPGFGSAGCEQSVSVSSCPPPPPINSSQEACVVEDFCTATSSSKTKKGIIQNPQKVFPQTKLPKMKLEDLMPKLQMPRQKPLSVEGALSSDTFKDILHDTLPTKFTDDQGSKLMNEIGFSSSFKVSSLTGASTEGLDSGDVKSPGAALDLKGFSESLGKMMPSFGLGDAGSASGSAKKEREGWDWVEAKEGEDDDPRGNVQVRMRNNGGKDTEEWKGKFVDLNLDSLKEGILEFV
uniref:Uncharacterized protein n=1 Tax=Chromera velia CCMP2878 TaxID=1169474 RepID=A0A0G4GYM0_9ALVE|eukprot:Cvel_5417.t1-p1 / transcript=Cvel_5417.t1 / gene=Cvel_5417 / organism=Chromera_velia_CCMP2878 / gene_product=hypothetical protein / transcript_product=hypothetical protein / location=Cvel_scaffold252:37900-41481(-) / protein_length=763 / sequence_SO=supercontig / SO=protein_coding / is_pseudo=false